MDDLPWLRPCFHGAVRIHAKCSRAAALNTGPEGKAASPGSSCGSTVSAVFGHGCKSDAHDTVAAGLRQALTSERSRFSSAGGTGASEQVLCRGECASASTENSIEG